MLQGNKSNRWPTIHRSVHPHEDQNEAENFSMDWLQKHILNVSAHLYNRISENVQKSVKVIKFITKAMKIWLVELTMGEQTLAEVKIRRGIFLEKSLFAATICKNNDVTQLHFKELHWGLQIQKKITRRY